MKSQKKKTNSLELELIFSDKNGELIKRLNKIFTTQKLPNKKNFP